MSSNSQTGIMPEIAKFEKVSIEQWLKVFEDAAARSKEGGKLSDQDIEALKADYENIKLPERATSGSAGYDIFLPVDIPRFIQAMVFPYRQALSARLLRVG